MGGCSFCILNIAYPAGRFKHFFKQKIQYSTFVTVQPFSQKLNCYVFFYILLDKHKIPCYRVLVQIIHAIQTVQTKIIMGIIEGKEELHMIELNYRDARPIYEQIKDSLRRLVLSSVIKQDEKLPSVRELASQLAINPNTIQKAYCELEQEGFIYTVSGRGSFAAPLSEVQSNRREELLKQFDEAVTELLYLKKEPQELKQRIDALQQGGAAK